MVSCTQKEQQQALDQLETTVRQGDERPLGLLPSLHPPGVLALLFPADAMRAAALAEQVEFRHPACKPGAGLEERSARLTGSGITLLPDLRPAIVERLRPADAATLARLRPLWAAHGMPLPPEGQEGGSAGGHLVEVCLEDDPDAPAFPYPPCHVLGPFGLQPLADRRSSPAVQAVLARLRGGWLAGWVESWGGTWGQTRWSSLAIQHRRRPLTSTCPAHQRTCLGTSADDLQATPFKFLGDKLRVSATAHDWWPDGMLAPKGRAAPEAPPPPPLTFTTARQLEKELASKPPDPSKEGSGSGSGSSKHVDLAAQMGAEFSLDAFTAGEGGAGVQRRQRRQYADVPPSLQAAFDKAKQLHAEAERSAVARPGGITPGTAASSAAPVGRQPLALRQAASAAGGTQPRAPAFKKIAGAAAGTAPKKPAANAAKAGGQKRAAAAKPPTGAKRAKAGAAAAAAAPAAPGSVAAGTAMPPSAPPSAAATAAGGSAAAQPGGMAPPSAAAGAAGTAAAKQAAPPKAAAKPRPKAADIDLAAGKGWLGGELQWTLFSKHMLCQVPVLSISPAPRITHPLRLPCHVQSPPRSRRRWPQGVPLRRSRCRSSRPTSSPSSSRWEARRATLKSGCGRHWAAVAAAAQRARWGQLGSDGHACPVNYKVRMAICDLHELNFCAL